MTYVGDRVVFDADSHVMELPGWLEQFADAATAKVLRPLALGGAGALADRAVEDAAARQAGGVDTLDPDPEHLLRPKGWSAVGAFDSIERSFVLDQFGFAAQLVFPTFAATQFAGRDLDLLFGGAEALNRAMAAFCADDPRLLAVASVPWGDPRRTVAAARRAIDDGCAAVMVASDLPRGVVSPTHPDHQPLWGLLEAENVPVVTHIGGGGRPVRPGFHDNGHTVTDFLGGGENVRAKDFMAIHQRPEVFWAALVLDGVFERFPGLRGASVEEGAMWVVPWIRRLDRATAVRQDRSPTSRPHQVAQRVRQRPPAIHTVRRRARRLDDRAGRCRLVHVLLRLPAPRGNQGPRATIRVDDGHRRRCHPRLLLPGQLRSPVPRHRPGLTRRRP